VIAALIWEDAVRKFVMCIAMSLGFSLPALAQLDAYKLEEKYGPPMERETFTVRPGIEMVVDYGLSKQVCRIQLPSGTQYGGTIQEGAVTKQRIEEVLDEVVPASMRGKEINKGTFMSGLLSVSMTIYEHLTISESNNGQRGTGITVTFNDSGCPKPTDH
jgi:hypothetical protein